MTLETEIAESFADRIISRVLLGARLEVSFIDKARSHLSSLFTEVRKEVVTINPLLSSRSSVRKLRLQVLSSTVDRINRTFYGLIKAEQNKELSRYHDTEVIATQVEMRRSFNDNGLTYFVAIPRDQMDKVVLGSPLGSWWDAQQRKLSQSLDAEFRKSVIANEGLDGMMARIASLSETHLSYAKTLVKTSVMAIGNLARFAVMEANLTYIDAYVQLSKLDTRSSTPCIARAGLLWDARTKEPRGHSLPFEVPPLHYCCRSVPAVKLKGGHAPKDQDADEWIRSLSSGQQDRLLGKERAGLYRRGDIIARDLIDQSNRPLSLAELSETIGED